MRILLLIIFIKICFLFSVHAQLTIHGVVVDSVDLKGIDFLQVELYNSQTLQLIDYLNTESDGSFSFKITTGIFEIRTNSLVYQPSSSQIIALDTIQKDIQVKIYLNPKVYELGEAKIVDRKHGILVKEDTIVYDMESWIRASDANLEQVLHRMPGLKILANGEIEFKGKQINHVLINGEKVSDVGSGMITQSIDPSKIASIEVRTKEKNDKLKSSLLDNRDVLVLDIKLKKVVETTRFGQVELKTGLKPELVPDAYVSLFSLNKKVNLHLLAEYNPLSKPRIQLQNIQNIGREAFQKVFEIPADYQRLTEKPEFNEEIYGFKNLASRESITSAISATIKPHKYWDVYLGTYLTKKNSTIIQHIILATENSTFFYDKEQRRSPFDWKNKFDVIYNKKGTRFQYSFNTIRNNGQYEALNVANDRVYQFDKTTKSNEIYNTLLYEKKFNEQWGLGIYGLYSQTKLVEESTLEHQDSIYALHFGLPSLLNPFGQKIEEHQKKVYLTAQLNINLGEQSYIIGGRYFFENYAYEKSAEADFLKGKGKNSIYKIEPFFKQEGSIGPVYLSNTIGYGFYKEGNDGENLSPKLTLKSDISTSIGDKLSLNVNYSRGVPSYPFRNKTEGVELIDFQSFASSQVSSLSLPTETSLQVTIGLSELSRYAFKPSLAYLHGLSYNSASYDVFAFPFSSVFYDQNKIAYDLAVLKFEKELRKTPLKFEMEIGYMQNKTDNGFLQENGQSLTQRYLLNFNTSSHFKKSVYNFEIRNNIRHYEFQRTNEIVAKSDQNVLITRMANTFQSPNKRHLLRLYFKYGLIKGKQTSENTILSLSYRYKFKKMEYKVGVHNLLNSLNFISEEILPAYKIETANQMIARYFYVAYLFQF